MASLRRENPAVPVLEGLHFFLEDVIVLLNTLLNLVGNVALVSV